MAVGSTVNSAAYSGNGSTSTPYVIPFRFDDSTWLTVTVTTAAGVETELAEGVGYTLSGDGTAAEATLTTAAAVPGTSTLAITRLAPALQSAEFENNQPLDLDALEAAFDRLAMALQDALATRAPAVHQHGPADLVTADANAGVKFVPNEDGSVDLAMWDQGTSAYRRVRLHNGALIVLADAP